MYKILLVDDDPDLRASLGALLRQKMHEVSSASNKKEAYEVIKQNKPDLILLDINMTTDQEGLDMAMELKENSELSGIPIIIVTGIEVMTGSQSVVDMAREMRMDPAFQNLNVLLLKGVDGSVALDFKSSQLNKSVNLPVAGFLKKPVHPDILFQEIQNVMA